MSHDIARNLVKRHDKLVDRRRLFEKEWTDCADYILPRKAMVLRGLQAGAITTTRLYSSTAIKANADLASAMQGALTNAAIRWFKLKFPFEELNNDPDASAWLEDVSNRMFIFIQQSNFDAEVNEAYLDLGAFGTSCTFLDWDPQSVKLRYKTLTIGEYVIAEGREGRANLVGRKYEMTVSQLRKQFGDEVVNQVERIKKNIEIGDMDSRHPILHVVGPRPEERQDPRKADVDPTKRPWAEYYISTEENHAIVLFEGGYHEFPWLVARWSKNANEEYGRGPGQTSLPDVKTLNRARQLKFRHWSKIIDPPLLALEEGTIGEISLAPSSLNFVRELDALKPIEVGGQPQVTQINEAELIQAIKEVFFSDLVNLPPIQGTPMSATEAAQRFELMERKLGPTVGRLKSELLQPNIDRVFGLMQREGFIPDPPSSVIQFFQGQESVDMQVEFEGPLERAQQQSDLVAVERAYGALGPIAQLKPEILDVLDHDALAVFTAKSAGLPNHFILPEEEVAATREARAKAEEEAQKAALAAEQGKGMKSAAGAVRELSQAGVELPGLAGEE